MGDHAARISTPGAAISGYKITTQVRPYMVNGYEIAAILITCTCEELTLRMSGVAGFGPLEEKGAT